ncbi:MAG: hypothetical protein AAFR36_16845 [Bacteroidota bacterium]
MSRKKRITGTAFIFGLGKSFLIMLSLWMFGVAILKIGPTKRLYLNHQKLKPGELEIDSCYAHYGKNVRYTKFCGYAKSSVPEERYCLKKRELRQYLDGINSVNHNINLVCSNDKSIDDFSTVPLIPVWYNVSTKFVRIKVDDVKPDYWLEIKKEIRTILLLITPTVVLSLFYLKFRSNQDPKQ